MDPATLFTPALILLAEVCVVTLGTLRIIFVLRGHKYIAPLLGFFEILIWLFAISQIMQNLTNWACFFAFAVGFTMGNFFGIIIEKKLAMGIVMVRIITHRDAALLIEQLRLANFGVTSVVGQGAKGKVHVVMTVIKRKQLPEVVSLIETHHPNAFYAVDELQATNEGIFPSRERPGILPLPLFRLLGEKMFGVANREPAFSTQSPGVRYSEPLG